MKYVNSRVFVGDEPTNCGLFIEFCVPTPCDTACCRCVDRKRELERSLVTAENKPKVHKEIRLQGL